MADQEKISFHMEDEREEGGPKKRLVVNAAVCDARNVAENTLRSYSGVTINAVAVLTSPASAELLHRYDVTINAAGVLEVPDGAPLLLRNGSFTIGAGGGSGADGAVLLVNGKLTVEKGAEAALAHYAYIQVNGALLCPRSLEGGLGRVHVNGSTEFYPDDAVVLRSTFTADRVFALRARKGSYYASRRVLLLDPAANPAALAAKGVVFLTRRAVVAESLLEAALPLFPEDTEIIAVPDGCGYVPEDAELTEGLLRRHGPKLYIDGDLRVPPDAAPQLARLEYLHADSVLLPEALADAFAAARAEYEAMQLYSGELLTDRPKLRIDRALLEAAPGGVTARDCAEVEIAPDVPPELLRQRLRLSECASVICSPEQRAAVETISRDVASIDDGDDSAVLSGDLQDGEGVRGDYAFVFSKLQENKVVNAACYKL